MASNFTSSVSFYFLINVCLKHISTKVSPLNLPLPTPTSFDYCLYIQLGGLCVEKVSLLNTMQEDVDVLTVCSRDETVCLLTKIQRWQWVETLSYLSKRVYMYYIFISIKAQYKEQSSMLLATRLQWYTCLECRAVCAS